MNTIIQVLWHIITKITFLPVSHNRFLIFIWHFIRMAFIVHMSTNILFMVIYVYSMKMEAFSPTFLSLSPDQNHLYQSVPSWQYWPFLAKKLVPQNSSSTLPGTLVPQNSSSFCYLMSMLLPHLYVLVIAAPYFLVLIAVLVSLAAITKYHKLGSLDNKYISHSSRGKEVQDKGARQLSSWWGSKVLADSSSCFADGCLFAICSHGRGKNHLSLVSYCKDTNPIYEGSSFKCHHAGD